MKKKNSPAEVIELLQSKQTVFVHGGAAAPHALLAAIVEQAARFSDLELVHLHTEGPAVYAESRFRDNFRVTNLFVGPNIRPYFDFDRVDYLPCFLSEAPALFRSGAKKLDAALLHVSPPDENGLCSLGVSVDVARAAFDSAKIVLAQVNSLMPRVQGEALVPIDRFDAYFEMEAALPQVHAPPPAAEEERIGQRVAELVEDGSCLQVGIGTIPNAILRALKKHRHLGLHTETWSDLAMELIEIGVIDNSQKVVHPGKTVSSFITGCQKVYDFVHNNSSVLQFGFDFVNDPAVISKNPRMVAINSAVEIDLTGQVCADSIGPRIISGVGGQMDFMRGAGMSAGGKSILAITSRTKKGIPRLVPFLKTGAGVVTTRPNVHWVITEYGAANLYGRTLHERAMALVEIAHPDDREGLMRGWREIAKSGG